MEEVTGTTIVAPDTTATVLETLGLIAVVVPEMTKEVPDTVGVVRGVTVVDAPTQKSVRRGLPSYLNPVVRLPSYKSLILAPIF